MKAETPAGSIRIRPDFLFRFSKTVVFMDAEFWHGHPTRCRIPETRREWWAAKIEGNRRRDRLQNRSLRADGWTVVRVWQHELKTSVVLRKLKQGGDYSNAKYASGEPNLDTPPARIRDRSPACGRKVIMHN